MKKGICKLCHQNEELCESHAISDSVFRKLFQTNNGQGIVISRSAGKIHQSQDSWDEPQLCAGCENTLNIQYDKYGLAVLRGHGVTVTKNEASVVFENVDLHKLSMFVLSVYYRAALSEHDAYRHALIDRDGAELLRMAFINDAQVPISAFSVKISRLVDLSGGFSDKELKGIIVSPYGEVDNKKSKTGFSICFVFEGFFIEIFRPGLPLRLRNVPGVVHKSNRTLVVPKVDIFSKKRLVDAMVEGMDMHVNGLTTLPLANMQSS